MALRRTMAYLANTVKFKIGGPRGRHNVIRVLSDSDHAGDRNLTPLGDDGEPVVVMGKAATLRSQSGTLIMLNGVPVYWRSVRQCVTSDSTAEAEIYAAFEAVKAGQQYQWRAEEIGAVKKGPFQLELDNKQAVSFANGTCMNSKLGGVFDRRDSRVRELRSAGVVVVKWIPRQENLSDILTHCMASGPFNAMVTH